MKRFCLLMTPAILLAFAACSQIREDGLEVPQEETPEAVRTKVLFQGQPSSETSYLVKFSECPTRETLKQVLAGEGVVSVEPVFTRIQGKEELEARFGLDRWYEVKLAEGANLDASVMQTASLKAVAAVEYDLVTSLSQVEREHYPAIETKATAPGGKFNDPSFVDQWHYINLGNQSYGAGTMAGADINVKDVWSRLTCGDPSIVIAVVDEGVKYSHPDLKDNMWVNADEIPGNGIDDDNNGYVDDIYGYNFVSNGEINWTNEDDSGHGTHCAGTIAAVNNNGIGVVGVAGGTGKKDGCRIMSCQVFSGKSGGSASIGARAIKYAADNGASIISCSFGYSIQFSSDNNYINRVGSLEVDAVHYFEATKNNDVLDGGIAIFAAGNNDQGFAHYPGAFVDIISVSAFGPDFYPAYYTNYGPGCNISAPGGNLKLKNPVSGILSTLPSEQNGGKDYGYMQGTSMACPHVSGVVALGLSYAKQIGKTFTVNEFKQLILASTNDIDKRIANASNSSYAKYYHKMGTGAIDTWRLMMQIEGIPTETAQLGKKQWIDLTPVLGTSSVSLSYLGVDVSQETIDALGLQTIRGGVDDTNPAVPSGNCYAYIQYGRLYVHPTKIGSGKFKIRVIGGGDHLGGGNNLPGGMEIDTELSLIVREAEGGNGTGGWL